ncbi:MAG: serine/threonine protein kinase [Lachnospiraceae bacterium]|nr:serine/threonine protein kinase [Lachnospiraceae bacterium]
MTRKEYTLPRNSGYRIVRRLGSGGEGTVYLVCHLCTEQLRAAKVLTNVRMDRKHELDMMKHLNHPSLPKIMDVLEQDGYLWLIMEYIQGRRLDQIVSKGMTHEQLWSVASQLSLVLMYLHSRREPVLHLDIKPSNILLRPDQTLVLIDFGTSIRGHSIEENAGKYGTRGFAAPEQQQRDGIVDVRTDLYGAGAVLYYCCYGHIPVEDEISFLRAGKYLQHLRFNRIINKCLQENPDKRYQDSRRLYNAICKAQRAEKFWQKIRKTFAATLLLLSVIILFINSLPKYSDNYLDTAGAASDRALEDISQRFTEISSEIVLETTTESAQNVIHFYDTERESELESVNEIEYHRLLDMAGGMGFSQAVECYQRASELYPGDSEWFLQILEQVTSDGIFEAEEENAVKELIYATSMDSGSTALEQLAVDARAYGLFTYRMGLAYWYYYDGTGGKSAAAWWFRLAMDSQDKESNVDWLESAVVLSRIGSYYGMLGSTIAEEERETKEWDYWNDLKELWQLYQEQEEKTEIRTQTAEEMLTLIVLKSGMLREYGASREDVTEVLDAIEEFINRTLIADDQKEFETLEEQSKAARTALERAYQE